MDSPQLLIFVVLTATLLLFLYGRWRHDIVALAALLASVILGLVPADKAFAGFSHPAVITVICVLVLSGALQRTGVVDLMTQRLLPSNSGPTVTIAALTAISAVLSGFMNNVGALALLMPVALQIAQRQSLPPGRVLMPLAFGTILGGMTTLIGTPSNLIVSGFRRQLGHGGFSMFDFAPVGVSVAATGVVFLALIGWRLVPARERAGVETFNTGAYFTEARLASDSKAAGMTLREAEAALDEADAQIISLVRNEIRLLAPHPATRLHEADILLIEADPETLAGALESLGLVFGEDQRITRSDVAETQDPPAARIATDQQEEAEDADADKKNQAEHDKKIARAADPEEFDLVELVILPGSGLSGRTARNVNIRKRFGVNLLAISRQGSRIQSRVRSTTLRHGDVLLMQGSPDLITEFAATAGCAPLATRSMRVPDRRKMLLATAIMVFAVAAAAFKLMPASISFSLGVLMVMVTRVLPLRNIYNTVDWPVIVLLGALLPVAQAMETTGAAKLIAVFLLDNLAQGNAIVALILILVVTMTLSDVMNNAATAAIMSPIAIGSAAQLGSSADPFLMAVAIGASCAFLTPIGHQNNTLILGPGGFRFGDYWPLGLPLEIVVAGVAVPMLLIVWPL